MIAKMLNKMHVNCRRVS